MSTIKEAAKLMFRRPSGILLVGFVLFGICLAEYMVLSMFFSMFGSINAGNGLESFVSFIQHIVNPIIHKAHILVPVILGGLVLVALLAGIVLAGYSNILNRLLNREPKEKREISKGIKKYFLTFSIKSFVVLMASVLFGVFMMVSTVPAIVMTRAVYGGRSSLLAASVVFDILTLMVLFFGFMFYRIYILFWYPSTMNSRKWAFLKGKKVADKAFWKILRMFLFFDVLFIIPQILVMIGVYATNAQEGITAFKAGVFLGDWIFKTLFFSLFLTTVFYKYNELKNTEKESA
ncbi:MAG: hypothetical protein N2645_13505 [Clostridia bacterium]|nr:hypothetical protein [Clostridia bacterium]